MEKGVTTKIYSEMQKMVQKTRCWRAMLGGSRENAKSRKLSAERKQHHLPENIMDARNLYEDVYADPVSFAIHHPRLVMCFSTAAMLCPTWLVRIYHDEKGFPTPRDSEPARNFPSCSHSLQQGVWYCSEFFLKLCSDRHRQAIPVYS
jgi:hypothetical protein